MAGFNWYPIVRLEKLKIETKDTNISKTRISPSLLNGKESLTLAAVKQEECLATKNIKPKDDPSGSQSRFLEIPQNLNAKIKDKGASHEQDEDTYMPSSTFLQSLDSNAIPTSQTKVKIQEDTSELVALFPKCENRKQETDSDSQNEIKIQKITTELVNHFPKKESLEEETDSKTGILKITAELVGPCPEHLKEKDCSQFSGNKSLLTVIKREKEFNESANEFSANNFSTSVGIKKENDQSTEEFSNVRKYSSNATNDESIKRNTALVKLEDEHQNHTNEKFIASVCGEPMKEPDVRTSLELSNALRCRARTRLSANERRKKIHCYQCLLCPFTHWNSSMAKKHFSMKHGEYICLLCSVTFKRKLDLRKHERVQHPREKTLSCALCLKKFLHKNELIKHQVVHSNEKLYHSPLNAETKYQLNLGERKFICAHCSRRFENKHDLRKHMSFHKDVETLLSCPTCAFKFKRDEYLNRHLKKGCRHLPCEFCTSKFKSKSDLQAHKKNKHFDAVKLPTCQKCAGTVSSESKFRSHIRQYVLTNSCFLLLSSQSPLKSTENAPAEA